MSNSVPPGSNDADRQTHEHAASSAAAALTREGTPVSIAASIYVPEDEICFFSLDAPSVDDVERVAKRAGLRLLRVAEGIPSITEG